MKNYQELKVWQRGMELVEEVYKIAAYIPREETFGLRSQLTRAAVSIPANIAEGSSRASQLDYKRFLQIALGSSFELETHLLIIIRIKLLSADFNFGLALQALEEVQKMLQSFIRKLSE